VNFWKVAEEDSRLGSPTFHCSANKNCHVWSILWRFRDDNPDMNKPLQNGPFLQLFKFMKLQRKNFN